ncbi:hypothetical protein ACF0H5_020610 [Mactra antiquata]
MFTGLKISGILCFLSRVIGDKPSRDKLNDVLVAIRDEITNLKERLNQKDIEIENLKQQIKMCSTDGKSKRLVMEMDFEEEI